MDENKVKQIVTQMLNSFSNTVNPQHRHNEMDGLPLFLQSNIKIVPGIGLPLMNNQFGYNFYIDPVDFNLVLIPNMLVHDAISADLYIGFNDTSNAFNNIELNSDISNQFSVAEHTGTNVILQSIGATNNAISDGTNSCTEQLNVTGKRYTSDGEFSLQFPDATLPTPQAGMLAFSGGVLYFCADGATFQIINLT